MPFITWPHYNVFCYLFEQETQNHVFLVMEYCNGGDLADYLSGNNISWITTITKKNLELLSN